jgi:hypothetical protein
MPRTLQGTTLHTPQDGRKTGEKRKGAAHDARLDNTEGRTTTAATTKASLTLVSHFAFVVRVVRGLLVVEDNFALCEFIGRNEHFLVAPLAHRVFVVHGGRLAAENNIKKRQTQ